MRHQLSSIKDNLSYINLVYGSFCRLKLKKDAQKHGPLVFVNYLYTAICDYYYLAANLT